MVRKIYRGGVSTGNTLRVSNSRFLQQYASEAGITCSVSDVPDETKIKEAKFLDQNGVFYSLNKKGRWLLPDLIKEEIATGLSECECKVSLLELHKLNKPNNCVGYFVNKGHTRRVLPNKTTYLNRKSVVKVNDRPKKRHNRNIYRRGGNHDDIIHPEKDGPSVEYHVVYPGSLGSAISDPRTLLTEYSKNNTWDQASKNRGKKQRRLLKTTENEINSVESDLDFIQNVCEVDEKASGEVYKNCGTASKLSDYFQRARRAGNGTSTKKKSKRKHNNSQNAVVSSNPEHKTKHLKLLHEEYLSKQTTIDVEDIEPNYTEKTLTESLVIPVDVILPKHEVGSSYLENKFANTICFAECHPRKFTIDITENIKKQFKHSHNFKRTVLQKFDLTSFVVFAFKKNYDNHHDVYRVHLNMATHISTVRIETLFDMMLTDMDDVLNRCFVYFDTLPPESFLLKDVVEIKCTPSVDFDNIRPYVQMKSNSIFPETLVFTKTTVANTYAVDFEWVLANDSEERCCNICFENISTQSCISSTSLLSCGHVFCDGCWREHLLNNFRAGLQKCLCPEYDCDKDVDVWTMVTLVNIRDIKRRQTRKITDNIDNSSPTLKWCPNKRCGRILQNLNSADDSGMAVVCKCGRDVCFSCTREAHWPASCEQFAFYFNKLNAFGHDVLSYNDTVPAIQVYGKHCPKCNKFIEKNGGCPSMVCVCGAQFCWSCVKLWSDHTSRDNCYVKKDSEGTMKKIIRHIEREVTGVLNPAESKLYHMALANRTERQHQKIKHLQLKVDEYKCRVKCWMAKNNMSNCDLGLKNPNNSIDDFLKAMINLKIELNYVSEFCFVILDSERDKKSGIIQSIRFAAVRLQALSERFYDLLCNDNFSHLKTVSKLISLRETATSSIMTVSALVCKYRRVIKKNSNV
ncbi:uncharacterized protein LOC126812512 [Patella vulgata]|uniref:uncharacterized protein LOC126812512 n=1 Tax=Patella vulgata TaxID=6465 RepID=UPI002180345F|nr:uncharacterized protein LOC126812512 [Patella vulgata]